MSASDPLVQECTTLTRYLVRATPSANVLEHYRRAHEQGAVDPPVGVSGYDRLLVRLARRGGFLARAADTHARFFAGGGLLRRKLILLVALLETDAAGRRLVDEADPGHALGFIFQMGLAGSWSVCLLLLGLPLLLPARLAMGAPEDPA